MRYYNLKQELKKLASEIRYWKSKRKLPARRELGKALWEIESAAGRRGYEFRHKHIAYCLLRGRQMYEIERPAPNNLPNDTWIEKIMDEHREDIHVCVERSA